MPTPSGTNGAPRSSRRCLGADPYREFPAPASSSRAVVPGEVPPDLRCGLRRLLTMSSRVPGRAPSGLPVRDGSETFRIGWNRVGLRPVVHGVGKSRGVGAALLAAGLALSGCASGDDQDQTTTTTPAAAQGPTNPWDLPLEQRPPLFDPCEEIPVEAVEEAIGSPIEPEGRLTKSEPGGLEACGWNSDEIMFHVLATWKSYEEYLANPTGTIHDISTRVAGRNALKLVDSSTNSNTCRYLFFTESGTVAISVGFVNSLNSFQGQKFSEICEVLDEVSEPIIAMVPEGDFR